MPDASPAVAAAPVAIGAPAIVRTWPWERRVPRDLRENMVYRRRALRLAGRDRAIRRDLRAKSADDLLFYVNTFCWTYDPRNPSRGLPSTVPFTTWPYQDDTLRQLTDCILTGRDAAVAKSRDMGASWMALAAVEWLWHFRAGLSFMLVSRKESYVDEAGNPDSLMWKIDFLHRHEPRWLLPRGRDLGDRDPSRRIGHLANADNGSVIDGESTTGDIGRGGRRTAAVIDEFAAFDLNDGFATLSATRDMTDCRIFLSTPKGIGNAFHKVSREVPGVLRIDLHWSRHPRKSRGLYRCRPGEPPELLDDWRGECNVFDRSGARRRVRYPEAYPFVADEKLRSPWYDEQCSRCATPAEVAQELDIDFQGSDCQFFDPAAIEALRRWSARDPERVGTLAYHPDTLAPLAFADEPGGRLRLWLVLGRDDAPPRDARYVVGADVSAGTGASNSTLCAYDRDTGEKVAELADPTVLPADFARLAVALCRWLNDALLVPDRSGPTGEVFVKTVLASGYGRLYYRRRADAAGPAAAPSSGRTGALEPGVWLNPQAKSSCLEQYRDSLSRRQLVNRSAAALDECLQFVRRMDGTIEHSAALAAADPSGARAAHGDLVVADALASLALADFRRPSRPGEAPDEIPPSSVAARMREAGAGPYAARPDPDALGDKWNP